MGRESIRSAGMSRVPPGPEDKTILRRALALSLLSLSVCSCLSVQPLSPTESAAEVLPTHTRMHSRPITPSPAATAAPLPKRAPVATRTAEASPSAGGPWVLIIAADGTCAAPEDGSGRTRITQTWRCLAQCLHPGDGLPTWSIVVRTAMPGPVLRPGSLPATQCMALGPFHNAARR